MPTRRKLKWKLGVLDWQKQYEQLRAIDRRAMELMAAGGRGYDDAYSQAFTEAGVPKIMRGSQDTNDLPRPECFGR